MDGGGSPREPGVYKDGNFRVSSYLLVAIMHRSSQQNGSHCKDRLIDAIILRKKRKERVIAVTTGKE